MGEWPDNWFRDGQEPADGDAGGGSDANGDKTVSIPSNQHPGGQYQVRQYPGSGQGAGGQGAGGQGAGGQGAGGQGAAGPRPAPPPGGWPQQPPVSSAGGPAGYGSGAAGRSYGGGLAAPARSPARPGGPGGTRAGGGRRWLRPRRIVTVLAVIVALLLVAGVGTYFYLNSKLTRGNILVDYSGRPSPGSGTNWLIAGSDSRQGLTKAQERQLSTGYVSGGRSDTILILHVPTSGKPLLISVPRDSYVSIPGYGMNKINAAYSIGGPRLLAETIQDDTGLYINHFMDIGFGGFVRVVNSVGGVRMCLIHSLYDSASGLHLKKGCHVLTGGEALAYVRDRHDFASQDLQREQDQRIFLRALLSKMTSPGVFLNPFKALPAASGAVSTLTVDEGTSLYQLFGAAEALRDPETTTVPIASSNYPTSAGDAVLWDSAQAKELFNDLQTGQTVPKSLITGSQQGT
jgi:LCP family protein required for cell wall assembly